MIARLWRGRIRARDAGAYAEYVRRTGIAGHRATPGNRASMMFTRVEGSEAEVVVISLWDSLEVIKAFAGDDPGVAVFYPEDDRFLVYRDLQAHHYDVSALEMSAAPVAEPSARSPIPHTVHANGHVQSLCFREPNGEATVGVITPGTYAFSSGAEERVTIVSGTLEVRRDGRATPYGPGETYVIPPNEHFVVHAAQPVAYVCRFIERHAPA